MSPKFTCLRAANRKFQFRESNAFSKFILSNIMLFLVYSEKSVTSCSSLIFSPIYLFFKYPVWSPLIIDGKMSFSLFAINLAIIL